MGANNLYFPSVGQTKSIKAKNYMVVDNERTGQPYKIYIEDFVNSLLSEGILIIEDELTADELAAVNGSNGPSALNPFATTSDIPTLTSELTNDSGFLTDNFYTADGTLAGNRVVTQAGFSLAFLGGVSSFGDSANPNARLQGVTNAVGMVALRGYHFGSGGVAGQFTADGANATAIRGDAQAFGGQGVEGDGYYGLVGKTSSGWALYLEPYGGNTNAAWMKGTVKTISPSASSLDTAFGVRNNTDTSWLSRTLGDGSSETLTGSHAFGITVNTSYRLYAYTSNLTAAFRGYHDGNSGIGVIAQADGSGGIGIQANAGGTNGIGVRMFGANYATVFNGKFLDETQASATPKFYQSDLAGEAALLATLAVGHWYYLLDGAGTAVVKVKV